MQTDPSVQHAYAYDWDQLARLAESGRALEDYEQGQRAQLRARLEQALDRVRQVERELEEIREDL